MTLISAEEQNNNYLKGLKPKPLEPIVIKELTYADKKDISMETGGILHDAATLVAHGIEPTNENFAKVKQWIDSLYRIKHIHQEKIKNQ